MEKGGKMISKKVNSVQEWLPVDEILENGIIKVKNKNYIKKYFPLIYNFEQEEIITMSTTRTSKTARIRSYLTL